MDTGQIPGLNRCPSPCPLGLMSVHRGDLSTPTPTRTPYVMLKSPHPPTSSVPGTLQGYEYTPSKAAHSLPIQGLLESSPVETRLQKTCLTVIQVHSKSPEGPRGRSGARTHEIP